MNAVEFINEHLDPMKVLEYYNFQEVTDKGQMIRARCKIHNGDNPTAFCWNKENNLWFCYTGDCGGGDVFSLIEKLEKCNFKTKRITHPSSRQRTFNYMGTLTCRTYRRDREKRTYKILQNRWLSACEASVSKPHKKKDRSIWNDLSFA